MNVFIANFGTANWAWKDCLERSTIAVMDDVRVHSYWQRDDREGYIAEAQRVLLSQAGTRPIRAVASRWFNVPTLMPQSSGDLWIHRAKEEVWWTESLHQPATSEVIDDPLPRGAANRIFVYHKLCKSWSDRTRKGGKLLWAAVHPKAQNFLFTDATCQQLSPDNALYAEALINGDPLSAWHSRPNWRGLEEKVRRGAIKVADPLQLSATVMTDSAWATVAQSGKTAVTVNKDKRLGFATKSEMEAYLVQLIEAQEGLCALTGVKMLHYGVDSSPDLRCSLDRIDSNGHYLRGNLQVVCWFANRWKGCSDNASFVQLISLIREGQAD